MGASAGQPNLLSPLGPILLDIIVILEYTCRPVGFLQSSPHPRAPFPNATVIILVVLRLSLFNDDKVVHTRIYLSCNWGGAPPTPKFKRTVQKGIRDLRGATEKCHVGIGR